MEIKDENINLDTILKFDNEMELNILAKKLVDNKKTKNLELEVGVELVLKSLLYYVVSTKKDDEMTLNQVLNEIENIKNDENKKSFVYSIDNLPIDHPARLYWREASSLSREKLEEIFQQIKQRIIEK